MRKKIKGDDKPTRTTLHTLMHPNTGFVVQKSDRGMIPKLLERLLIFLAKGNG